VRLYRARVEHEGSKDLVLTTASGLAVGVGVVRTKSLRQLQLQLAGLQWELEL
jgi:hypothetical protein